MIYNLFCIYTNLLGKVSDDNSVFITVYMYRYIHVQCAHKMVVSRVNDLLLWYVACGFEWLVILYITYTAFV